MVKSSYCLGKISNFISRKVYGRFWKPTQNFLFTLEVDEALLTENKREIKKDPGSALVYTRVLENHACTDFVKLNHELLLYWETQFFCFLPNILSIQENWCRFDQSWYSKAGDLMPKESIALFLSDVGRAPRQLNPLLPLYTPCWISLVTPALTSFSISPVELGLPHPNSTSGVACEAPGLATDNSSQPAQSRHRIEKCRGSAYACWRGIISLYPARASLVNDIPAGDGKIANLFNSVRWGGGGQPIPQMKPPTVAW